MAVDPLWSDVVVLCHFNGVHESDACVNETQNGIEIVPDVYPGRARLHTGIKQYGSASLCFPLGAAYSGQDYVDITPFPGGLGTAFCIEISFYINEIGETPAEPYVDPSVGCMFFNAWDGVGPVQLGIGYWDAGFGPKLYAFYYDADTSTFELLESSGSFALDTWHTAAVDYDGTTLRLFGNGTLVDSVSLSGVDFDYEHPFMPGCMSAADYFFVDELRITKASRRTSNYTPETAEFVGTVQLAVGAADGTLTATGSGAATSPGVGAVTGTLTVSAVGKALPYGEATCSSTVAGVGAATRAATASATQTLTGAARAPSPAVAEATGTLSADAEGESLLARLPIEINRVITVRVGLPIRIGLASSVSTVELPISLGQYLKTLTLPIRITTPTAVSTVSLPIAIYGDLSGQIEAGGTTWGAVIWRPYVTLDGANISAKLIGAIEIETEEMASPVASFALLPADGVIDPLLYVGKPVVIRWDRYVAGSLTQSALRFTGIVSDPTWDADQRVLSISATGDLQARLDRLTKTQIDGLLTSASPQFSQYIFGDPEDLSGWEYCEALISTTDSVIWLDANGALRVTSTLAKVTPDYTFGEADILSGSLSDSPSFPGRQDMLNKREIAIEYRHRRARERRVNVKFWDIDLETPSTYLSGNFGGWDLPQRTQVESAANSGGWVVIGDIAYDEVWPNGYYSSYSDSGTPVMIGWNINTETADELCVGATWTAARRWMQTIGEIATITVNATESQETIGILADNESYGIEDTADDETWESSLEYDDYATGAVLMSNGKDYKLDLDTMRADFEAAQLVAIAKARGDILRAHRGTTVSFATPFAPSLDLSHTVAVDTTYLQCAGKVRRIVDRWDIDSGDCTTTVDLALYRHNGAGLTSDTTPAATDQPADPDETEPTTRITIGLHIGGQDTQPKWSTLEDLPGGYFVNLPFDPTYGSATLIGGWSRNPDNPQVAPRIYEEGFHIKYPDIDAEYVDPTNAALTAVFEVAVPEDSLVITSG